MQSTPMVLVNSQTHRIVGRGGCLCGEPHTLGAGIPAGRAALALNRISSSGRYLEAVEDGLYQFSGRACAQQTRLLREILGVSSLYSLFLICMCGYD